jgi:hypothetical protein
MTNFAMSPSGDQIDTKVVSHQRTYALPTVNLNNDAIRIRESNAGLASSIGGNQTN